MSYPKHKLAEAVIRLSELVLSGNEMHRNRDYIETRHIVNREKLKRK